MKLIVIIVVRHTSSWSLDFVVIEHSFLIWLLIKIQTKNIFIPPKIGYVGIILQKKSVFVLKKSVFCLSIDLCLNSVGLETPSINEIFFLIYSRSSVLPRRFNTICEQKYSNLRPLLFITFPQGFWKSKQFRHWTSTSGGKKTVKRLLKKSVFFLCGDFTPFLSKKVQIWNHFFPVLFHKDSKYLKSLYIRLWEVGAKKRLNEVNKVWWTDKHTKQK